ncbi:guanine nucleotide-binding protein alpha-4 subunit-related [Anaeramoeba ignava]|uniref:Guanine nucleotide-binding protein alpha-4 subunit-related n=1 Tax=Anaeramoeba ignava TaxID=1746090 RepID=A0A9Q0RAF5_ANAIG|nr:guanine nucleotide-binding protein alpha-4 subunit-related [Anaeramoeba ignava]
MGNCNSDLTEEEKEMQKRNKRIDSLLKQDKIFLQNEIRILLLGAGESGKSTLFKQMKILQNGKFGKEESVFYKPYIYENCISQMKALINEAEKLGIPIENQEIALKFLEINSNNFEMNYQFVNWIQTLWEDQGIKKTYENKDKNFQFNDSTIYFFENIERIGKEDYIPTEQDVLHCRIRTDQIVESRFKINNLSFIMVDVGGQRTARRKWIHYFCNSTSVIFCASLIGYDQKLREDESVNRMHEALSLFREICHSPWFADTSMILFLNKKDLFKKRIKEVGLETCFPEYNGRAKNYQDAYRFIKGKFEYISGLIGNQTRKLYVFKTCAVDTQNIDRVFKSVSDTIMRNLVKDIKLV